MTIGQIAKRLSQGEQIDGWSLSGDILTDGKHFWTVYLGYRVSVTEIPDPKSLPCIQGKPKTPDHVRKICKDCGSEFVVSKYHLGRERCTVCARKFRQETGEDTSKICLRCGKEFFISKYRPYSDPQNCPSCSAVLRARKERDRLRAEGTLYEKYGRRAYQKRKARKQNDRS